MKSERSSEHTSDDGSDDGSQGSQGDNAIGTSVTEEGKNEGNFDNLERLRRQKRLAMNRESARNRRKRKKMMLETLEKQVEEMNKVNQNLRVTNEALTTRVAQLEGELGVARNTIAMLSSNSSSQSFRGGAGAVGAGGTILPGAGSLGGTALGGGEHLSRLAALQRQGLGGSSFLSDPSSLQYMHLLQQGGGGSGTGGGSNAGVFDSDILRLARERQGFQNRLGASGLADQYGSGGGDSALSGNAGSLDDFRRFGTFRGGAGADISTQLAMLRQGGGQQDGFDKNRSGGVSRASKSAKDP